MNLPTVDRPLFATLLALMLSHAVTGQTSVRVDSIGFEGVLHDNASNEQRQGSGFTPLVVKTSPKANLFRNDAVGLNFEHVFNGAKAQHDISMFTPRQDPCELRRLGEHRYEILWPSQESKWGIESRMVYDFSQPGQIDLEFECIPTLDLFSQGFVAMMWASYMDCAISRKIHFWGTEGNREGWVTFGEGTGDQIEVGTVSGSGVSGLPHEPGAQTLNLHEHPTKKFVTPFYYGLIDGDRNLETRDDPLLYLVLLDQTDSIRFAMWNFYRNAEGDPDTHSPAWDWQFVVRNPKIGQKYGYRARIVVQPYSGIEQVRMEYQRWRSGLSTKLPKLPPE